jgi:Flp pilus assembly protein TadG
MSGSRVLDMPGRRRHRRARGQAMVEFALIGPLAFLLLIGTIILGIIVLHEIQLTQAVRDGARAAAICGTQTDATATSSPQITSPPPTLPDGTPCTTASIVNYINSRVTQVDPTLAGKATVAVYANSSSVAVASNNVTFAGTVVTQCTSGGSVEVSITYAQPLYLPLVGNLFANPSGGTTRSISATGEATCEQ